MVSVLYCLNSRCGKNKPAKGGSSRSQVRTLHLDQTIKIKSNLKQDTLLVQTGRVSAGLTISVNPPLVRASTTRFKTLGDFKHSYDTLVFESPQYGRSGTSTKVELQSAMAKLEQA